MVENLILTANLNRVNFIATLIKNVYKRVSRKELLKRNKLLHRRSNEFKFCSFLIYFSSAQIHFLKFHMNADLFLLVEKKIHFKGN